VEGLEAYLQRHAIARLSDLTGSLDTSKKDQAWISS
jgi:hypothetical protein